MTELTIQLMAALADAQKIRNLDAALKRRCGERVYADIEPEDMRENYAYNVIATAFDYGFDEYEIAEMAQ